MRALFINHDTTPYGAAKSLQSFTREYADAEIDMLFQKPLFTRLDPGILRETFGQRVKKIFFAFLPFDRCYYGKPRNLPSIILKNLLYQLNRNAIRKIIRDGRYDFIHLNSLILHELIDPTYPFLIHVREISDNSNPKIAADLEKAAGIIFIDKTTKAPFISLNAKKTLVLNNPVDMTRRVAKNSPPFLLPQPLSTDIQKKTVFALIANHSQIKGTHFVIEAFKEFPSSSCCLLIVGGGDRDYLKRCKTIAGEDSRIIFIGEQKNAEEIYQICDFILRGDPFFCIGRTMLEALYSGCSIIIPHSGDPSDVLPEQENFKDKIIRYKPRDKVDLLKQLKLVDGTKNQGRQFCSNAKQYVAQFHAFALACSQKNPDKNRIPANNE